MLVADYGNFAIDRVTDNRLTTVAAFRLNSIPGLGGAFRPSGVAVGRGGEVYAVTDGVNGGTGRPALTLLGTGGKVQLLTPPNSKP